MNAARVVAWLLSGLIRNDSKPATDWAVFLVACPTLFAIQKSVAVAIYEVILFSVLKERLGKPAIRFEADSPVSCRALLDGLAGRYPPVAEFERRPDWPSTEPTPRIPSRLSKETKLRLSPRKWRISQAKGPPCGLNDWIQLLHGRIVVEAAHRHLKIPTAGALSLFTGITRQFTGGKQT